MSGVTVEVYQGSWWRRSRPQLWRWRAKASNGKILAISSESYTNLSDMLKVIATLFPGVRVKGV